MKFAASVSLVALALGFAVVEDLAQLEQLLFLGAQFVVQDAAAVLPAAVAPFLPIVSWAIAAAGAKACSIICRP